MIYIAKEFSVEELGGEIFLLLALASVEPHSRRRYLIEVLRSDR